MPDPAETPADAHAPEAPRATRPEPCALPHTRRAPRARRALAQALLPFLLIACDGSRAEGPRSGSDGSPRARVAALVEALEPLDPTLTSDKHDEHFLRWRALLAELRGAEREVGLEALRVLREEGSEIEAVERCLLDVAAHAAPEDTRPLLVALIDQYGAALALRGEAPMLLAETSPEQAVATLEPWLRKQRPGQTMPPMEFLVRAWVVACTRTGRSPVEVLALVATNLHMEDSARHAAVRALGDFDEPLALQALQTILTESSGNAYMRRLAAQGLVRRLPRESLCDLIAEVASREADLNLARFLADVLAKNCP